MTRQAGTPEKDPQIVAITAGASGIGRVVAEAFLKQGSVVYVCDVDAAALREAESAAEEATSADKIASAAEAPTSTSHEVAPDTGETTRDRGAAYWIQADVSRFEDVHSARSRTAMPRSADSPRGSPSLPDAIPEAEPSESPLRR